SLDAARGRVVADIRNAVEMGASRRAADLLIVLRWLLAPSASCDDSRAIARPRRRAFSARWRRGVILSSVAERSSTESGEVVSLFDNGLRR
ncbi:MAG: polysaccharide deacetylase, partial [Methylocystis sp.]